MAIRIKNGRARSYSDSKENEESLREEISRLSPAELETLRYMMAELTLGTVDPGQRILDVVQDVVWERPPVDIETFIRDPYFLGNTCDNLYPALMEDLKELFNGDYNEAIFCGSIGYGKTYAASIGICRLLYELSCMRDPQKAFGLAPGSLIALANMSVNETLAKKVVLENIGSKIQASPYFRQHFPFEATQKEFRFPKHVWLVARATTDNSVLGLNVIAAILDECTRGTTRILLGDGTEVEARELVDRGSFDITSFDFEVGSEVSVPAEIKVSSSKECLELILDNGQTFSASWDHPVAVRDASGVLAFVSLCDVLPGQEVLTYGQERKLEADCSGFSCMVDERDGSGCRSEILGSVEDEDRFEKNRLRSGVLRSARLGLRGVDRVLSVGRVVSTRRVGTELTYSICVPGYEVFVADGVLVHNTNFMYRNSGKQSSDGSRYGVVDQAETLYNSIKRRMKSRFQQGGKLPGILFIVSSKQTNDDFTARRINAGLVDPHVFVRDYALWEVKPSGHYSSDTFWVLCGNEKVPSKILDFGEEEKYKGDKCPDSCVLLEVPSDFRRDFESDLEASIRDIAGIATVAISPFIQRREKILAAVDTTRKHPFSVIEYNPKSGGSWIWDEMVHVCNERDPSGNVHQVRRPILNPTARRHVHIDPSLRRDAAGFCLGHVAGVKAVIRRAEDGREFVERAPIYVVDAILRIVPPIGGELLLSDFRHLIYELTAQGYPITHVTLDSYQSADTIQQLCKKGYTSEVLSVDISPEPYDEVKLALYEDRLHYYEYPVLIRELQLVQEERKGHRRKIDHPLRGSKDCSDALAGLVYSLLKRVHTEPLPLLQGSLTNDNAWMPEQSQAVQPASEAHTPHSVNLPPLLFGSQGGTGWGNDF